MKNAFSHDLSTVAGRSLAFNTRIDELTANGMSFNAAVEKMRETPADAELLTRMGDFHKLDPKHDKPHTVGALPHLWTPEARRRKFNELIDHLTGPKDKGGHGLNYEEAIEEMKRNPEMRKLIDAMGAEARTAPAANSAGAAVGSAPGLAINNVALGIGGRDWLKLSP